MIRLGIVLKNKLNSSGELVDSGELNMDLDTTNCDQTILQNLLNYMKIQQSDTNITLDEKLNRQRMAPKKPFRTIKKSNSQYNK